MTQIENSDINELLKSQYKVSLWHTVGFLLMLGPMGLNHLPNIVSVGIEIVITISGIVGIALVLKGSLIDNNIRERIKHNTELKKTRKSIKLKSTIVAFIAGGITMCVVIALMLYFYKLPLMTNYYFILLPTVIFLYIFKSIHDIIEYRKQQDKNKLGNYISSSTLQS